MPASDPGSDDGLGLGVTSGNVAIESSLLAGGDEGNANLATAKSMQ